MPSDESNTVDPPKSDISGSPGDDGESTLAAEMRRQVDELAQRRYRPEDRHGLHLLMRQRRRLPHQPTSPGQAQPTQAAEGDGEDITQFDYLPAEVGWDTLLVKGELLITRESFERARQSDLPELEMTEEQLGCECLRDEILTLTHREGRGHLSATELATIARILRQRGHSAALTHVVAAGNGGKGVPGPVGKGYGGPRPVPARDLPPSARPKRPKVAIIDTGISEQRRSTVSVASQVDDLHQFPLGNSAQAQAERAKYLSFAAGHGTFVTGIVQQLAPDTDITVYRVMDSDGIGSEVGVACAMIRAATKDENQIINLSLGFQTHDDVPPIAIQRALEIISEWEQEDRGREVVVVAAAGNYGDTRPCWPAAFPGVVSVGGLGPDMRPTPWSGRGVWVTCSTVGQGLVSTFVEGTESTVVAPPSGAAARQPEFRGDPPWAAWSGTSFAAPQITGRLAAGYQPGGKASLGDVLDALLESGQRLPNFGQVIKILPGV
jgi:hypothetical protein